MLRLSYLNNNFMWVSEYVTCSWCSRLSDLRVVDITHNMKLQYVQFYGHAMLFSPCLFSYLGNFRQGINTCCIVIEYCWHCRCWGSPIWCGNIFPLSTYPLLLFFASVLLLPSGVVLVWSSSWVHFVSFSLYNPPPSMHIYSILPCSTLWFYPVKYFSSATSANRPTHNFLFLL